MNDWSKANTVIMRFADVPVGGMFAYAASGPIRISRNVFTKVEPFTASAPNATSAESSKLKLWFEPEALVRVRRPVWLTDRDMETIQETRAQAYEREKRKSASERYKRDHSMRADRCQNCYRLSGDHDLRTCGGKSADRAEARLVATILNG